MKRARITGRLLCIVWILSIFCLMLGGCGASAQGFAEESAEEPVTDIRQLDGKAIGVLTGSSLDVHTDNLIHNADKQYYDRIPDLALAVEQGKISGFLIDEPIARTLCLENKAVTYLPEILVEESYAAAFSRTERGAALRDEYNEYLAKIRSDGTLEEIDGIWLGADESKKEVENWTSFPADNGVVRMAVKTDVEPFCYIKDGNIVGYDVDIMARFCREYGYGLEVISTELSSIFAGLSTGAYDVSATGLTVTEERAESVNFSDPNYIGGIVAVVANPDQTQVQEGFWQGLSDSFRRNFIEEARWKMILSGLGVTFVISICSALAGTVLGFGLCLMRRSRKRILSGITAAFIRLIQGIPVLVLLMVLFYVVFASARLDGIVVSVIGFSINFAVYVSEMIRTGINAVDAGQWEAAAAMGFGRVRTFTKIIAPQAARHILPVYKGEFISMVKMTSVVGYIAVQDLTKVTDIIRSRTYEAFFPLILTAVLYFLLAWSLTLLLGLVEKKVDPRRRSRVPKGIDMNLVPQEETWKDADSVPYKGPAIRIMHLKKVFDSVTPLKDVNALISRGEIISIIGPSGTGKSTLLRCLNRLETPTDGKIEVFGQPVTGVKASQLSAVRRRMGMVFQSFNLFAHLTVIENIMLGPVELLGCTRQQAYERGMHLLARVGLAEKALNYPDELSGGQKQRAAIARTLGMQPEIVLFDEPTSALDPTMVGEVLSVIRRLAGQGLTMLIVTHEMKFARDVSTRVFYMDEGVVYEEGVPEQIFEHPRTGRCRAFVRRMKTFHLDITSRAFDFIGAATDIELFAHRQLLSAQQSLKYQQIFEELCMTCILPTLPDNDCRLSFDALCSEDGSECEAVIQWQGEPFDPLTQGDDLGVVLAVSRTKSRKHEYADGVNTVTIEF